MGVRNVLLLLAILFLAASTGVPARAQEPPVQEIAIEISTNFLTAYRDGTWVPVDVIVRNTKKDITGELAIQLSSAGTPQAPVYRVPVDSPRGSTKRFRLYCFFETTSDISAMLYDNGRPAIRFPFKVQLPTPIMQEDFLHLVLDMNPDEGYAFLHRAVNLQGENVRAVRESLRPSEMDALPDYPQCYEPYDAVMIGNLDPTRIAVPQRELLLQFVQRGGTLIINTGANAPLLRGTWLEEASGVAFTTDIALKETDLATAVFGPSGAQDARPDWECVFTELTPRDPETQTFGADRILATRRPLGQGQIVTLAVDVDSKSLQRCPAYIEFWSKLCTRRRAVADPFFREAAWEFTQMIPQTAGIRVHPRSSVVMYLAVYFGLAIVANWVVWSILKRREMAWVCLVFFSIGFTLYAMIVGTAGRAKANEMREVQILQVPQQGGMSRLHTVTGILTARTLRFAMNVNQENMLISDLGAMPALGMVRGPQGGSSGRRPFQFTLGSPGRIEDFVVGASEVRSFEGDAFLQLPGGFQGELVLDGEGLRGALKNETGFTLENPCLLLDGALIPLKTDIRGAFDVNINYNQLQQKANEQTVAQYFPGIIENPHVDLPYSGLPASFVGPLLTGSQAWQGSYYGGQYAGGNVSWLLGPCICGWAQGAITPCIQSEREFRKQSASRFVMADVRVKRAEASAARWVQLNASTQYQQGFFSQPQSFSLSGPVPITVYVPASVPIFTVQELEVDIYSDDVGGFTMCVPAPFQDSAAVLKLVSSDKTDFMGRRMFKNVYAVQNWQKDLQMNSRRATAVNDPRYGVPLYFNLELKPVPGPENMNEQERRAYMLNAQNEMNNNYRSVYVTGRAKIEFMDQQGREGIPWR